MKTRLAYRPGFSSATVLRLAAIALLALAPGKARAANYYWDSNGTTPGLGDTAGTWGSSTFVVTLSAAMGRGLLGGTVAGANTTTTNTDLMYFGTINLALGSTASTIGIAPGGVIINAVYFGVGQGSQAVTLSGGGGAITLAGATPAIYANNTANTIAATLAGTNGLTKAGAGTLTLTASNTYTGATIVNGGGTLIIGDGTGGSLNNATPSALTFNAGGGVFNVAEAAGSAQGMGALTFSAGDATVISTAAGASPTTATLTFASLAARAAGACGNFSLAGNTTIGENNIVLTSTANAPLSGSGANNAGLFFGGAEYARYDEVYFCFRAVNHGSDNNAPAAVSGGTIGVDDAAQDVKLNGDITAQTTAAANTINLAANSLTLLDASQILSVNGILSAGAASASVATAGILQPTGSGGELVVRVNGPSDGLSIQPVIQNNASASALTKSGAGTLTLSGTNTYTGTTRINAGTLAVSGGAALADAGAVVLANAAGARLLLNANETIGNLSGGGFSGGNVDVQSNTLTLSDNTTQSFGGTFIGTGSGAIVKQGTGTLTLNNSNAFAGTITLNAGTLTFAFGNSATVSALPLSSGGAINMAGGTILNFAPAAQVAWGQNTMNSPSQLASTNGWTIGNAINVSSGTASFRFAGNSSRWNFTGGVTGGAGGSQTLNIVQGTPGTIGVGGGGDAQAIVFSGVIQDGTGGTLGVNVEFTNSQTLGTTVFVSLGGQNTFTGPMVVKNSRGITGGAYLAIGGERNTLATTTGSGHLGGGNYANTISLATGTILNYLSSAGQILGGAISGAGAVLKQGGGTLTLSATNTYSGITTIGAGALEIGGAGVLGGGAYAALITNNATLRWNSSAAQTLSGVISGTGALIKGNSGTLTLTGTNTSSGATTVSNGTLLVHGSLGTNTVTVAGGTLGGTGTIGGKVTCAAGGSLAPGASAGTLTLTNSLDISAQAAGTGKLYFELDAPNASDLIVVTRTNTIGSGVLGFSDFVFTNLGGLATGTNKLITSGTLSGTLDGGDLSGAIGAFTGTLQINGNDLELAVTGGGCVIPTAFNVTGGGAYCSGDAGVAVGLDGSESGVDYQLYRNGGATAVGSPVAGTGSAIGLGTQTVTDTYTVVGTRTAGGCTNVMTGSATVTVSTPATANAGPDQSVGHNDPVTLAGSFGGSASSALWSGGGGSYAPDSNTLNAVYTPSAGEKTAGTVTLTLTTDDPAGPCGPAADSVTITLTNTPPVASNFTMGAIQGGTTSVTIIAGKHSPSDADGDPLTVTDADLVTPANGGSVSVVGGTAITYVASVSFTGTDTFTYVVSDGFGGSSTATVEVIVGPAGGGLNITAISVTGSNVRVTALGVPAATYRLQYTDSLLPVSWQAVAGSDQMAATNGTMTLWHTNGVPVPAARYYSTFHISGP